MESIKEGGEEKPVGCEHYKRKCKLHGGECNEYYFGRFCHDEEWVVNCKEIDKHHEFDRHSVQSVRGVQCNHEQPPALSGEVCGVDFAKYVCLKCNLFDDDGLDKELYHGDDGTICRVGGSFKSYHGKAGDICLPISMKESHSCTNYREAKGPIGCEGFYNVRDAGGRLNGGHVLHSACYDEYFKNKINGPLGKKFAFSDKYKEDINRHIENEIENTVMSEELSNLDVKVIGNDGFEESMTKFNIIALKGLKGNGYNTSRIK